MLLPHSNKVTTDNGPRPAGKPDQCFYCGQPLGADHATDCVCRQKIVMIKVEMTIPFLVPASWNEDSVEFQLNDSSWCADSIEHDLVKYMKAKSDDAPCLCEHFTGTYLREATEDDLVGIDTVKLYGLGKMDN